MSVFSSKANLPIKICCRLVIIGQGHKLEALGGSLSMKAFTAIDIVPGFFTSHVVEITIVVKQTEHTNISQCPVK